MALEKGSHAMKFALYLVSLLLVAGCAASQSQQHSEEPVAPAGAAAPASAPERAPSVVESPVPAANESQAAAEAPVPAELAAPAFKPTPVPARKPAVRKSKAKARKK
jgi:hypothetical protein